jgi:hypothetical protein
MDCFVFRFHSHKVKMVYIVKIHVNEKIILGFIKIRHKVSCVVKVRIKVRVRYKTPNFSVFDLLKKFEISNKCRSTS